MLNAFIFLLDFGLGIVAETYVTRAPHRQHGRENCPVCKKEEYDS
jgi:hypothetical protein